MSSNGAIVVTFPFTTNAKLLVVAGIAVELGSATNASKIKIVSLILSSHHFMIF